MPMSDFCVQGVMSIPAAASGPFLILTLPKGFDGFVRLSVTGASVGMKGMWIKATKEGLPEGMAQLTAANYGFIMSTSTVILWEKMTGGYSLVGLHDGGTSPALIFEAIGEFPESEPAYDE